MGWRGSVATALLDLVRRYESSCDDSAFRFVAMLLTVIVGFLDSKYYRTVHVLTRTEMNDVYNTCTYGSRS